LPLNKILYKLRTYIVIFRLNKSLKKYLKTEDYEILHRMNGSIAGLGTFMKSIPESANAELFKLPVSDKIIESLVGLEKDAKEIEGSLRSLREIFDT